MLSTGARAVDVGPGGRLAGVLHPVAAGTRPPDRIPVREIVGRWGVRPRRVERIGGDRNVHWSVHDPTDRYILRCYRADRDAAAIAYEFDVIAHLAAAGWPVAVPVGPATRWQGHTFALFPRLPGTPGASAESGPVQEWRGELLARLHHDLAGLGLGQRSGWRRIDEFLAAAAEPLIADAETVLADRPGLRDLVVATTVQTHAALAAHAAELPVSVVHGDFAPWNLLRQGGLLSGLIDLDDVRLDLTATDLAIARRRDRDAVVAGYRRHAALSDVEQALLAPLWRAYTLRFVADLLRAPVRTAAVESALIWCARQLAQTSPSSGPPSSPLRTSPREPTVNIPTAVQTPSRTIRIGTAGIPYLLADRDRPERVLRDLSPDRWLLVADGQPELAGFRQTLADRLGRIAPVHEIAVPARESDKSLDTVAAICARALEYGASRASVLVAVGGGNVANITGLCAALLYRGIRLVQVPTTLIGMSDVVLSLKQGVNFHGVKNGLGTFYAPELILADPSVLRTLPPTEIRAGLAEIIKNALTIAPEQIPVLLELLRPDSRYSTDELTTMIGLALDAKSRVLADDAHERHTALVLEYGHTVGHAIEALVGGQLGHGLSVALGMRVAAGVARQLGLLDPAHAALHDRLLRAAGLPMEPPADLTAAMTREAVAAQIGRDNKRGCLRLRPSQIPMVLLAGPGVPATTHGLPLTGVDIDLVTATFQETFGAPGRGLR